MPKERFYHPTAVEGREQQALDEGHAFEVAWGRVTFQDRPSVAVAGIAMDKSGVDRLIATLRRAKRQAFPHRMPCIDGSVCDGPHCPPRDVPSTP